MDSKGRGVAPRDGPAAMDGVIAMSLRAPVVELIYEALRSARGRSEAQTFADAQRPSRGRAATDDVRSTRASRPSLGAEGRDGPALQRRGLVMVQPRRARPAARLRRRGRRRGGIAGMLRASTHGGRLGPLRRYTYFVKRTRRLSVWARMVCTKGTMLTSVREGRSRFCERRARGGNQAGKLSLRCASGRRGRVERRTYPEVPRGSVRLTEKAGAAADHRAMREFGREGLERRGRARSGSARPRRLAT